MFCDSLRLFDNQCCLGLALVIPTYVALIKKHQETLKIGIVIIIKQITAIVRVATFTSLYVTSKLHEFLYFSSFYRLGN